MQAAEVRKLLEENHTEILSLVVCFVLLFAFIFRS